jgi:hypothetical protein
MIMDITIHNLFINEENPCDEEGQNRSEKCNNIVKDLLKRSQRIKKQCELEQAIKECKEIILQSYSEGVIKVEHIGVLFNLMNSIEVMIKQYTYHGQK